MGGLESLTIGMTHPEQFGGWEDSVAMGHREKESLRPEWKTTGLHLHLD